MADVLRQLVNIRAPDQDDTKEKHGAQSLLPATAEAVPLYPSYLAHEWDSVAFHAAEKAAKYAKMANYFQARMNRDFLLAKSAQENSVKAYEQVLAERSSNGLERPLYKAISGFCSELRSCINSVENGNGDSSSSVCDNMNTLKNNTNDLTIPPMVGMRNFCGQFQQARLAIGAESHGAQLTRFAMPPNNTPKFPIWPPELNDIAQDLMQH